MTPFFFSSRIALNRSASLLTYIQIMLSLHPPSNQARCWSFKPLNLSAFISSAMIEAC